MVLMLVHICCWVPVGPRSDACMDSREEKTLPLYLIGIHWPAYVYILLALILKRLGACDKLGKGLINVIISPQPNETPDSSRTLYIILVTTSLLYNPNHYSLSSYVYSMHDYHAEMLFVRSRACTIDIILCSYNINTCML